MQVTSSRLLLQLSSSHFELLLNQESKEILEFLWSSEVRTSGGGAPLFYYRTSFLVLSGKTFQSHNVKELLCFWFLLTSDYLSEVKEKIKIKLHLVSN